MENKYMKKEIVIITVSILAISCFVYIFFKLWNAQYRHGLYHQPFCGQLDASGLTLLGEIDSCGIYMYNMEDLTYVTWRGNRVAMEKILEEFHGSKEDIFPIDGETQVEIIAGHPIRVNRYEALVTLDLGGAMIFMHYTQDLEEAYRDLLQKY